MKNFLGLDGLSILSILSVPYMYIDHKDYLADSLLAQNHVSVRLGNEFSRDANSHFLRTAGPHSPDSPGHIKRTVLEISRAERGLRPANQYQALSQKAMPSQSVR